MYPARPLSHDEMQQLKYASAFKADLTTKLTIIYTTLTALLQAQERG